MFEYKFYFFDTEQKDIAVLRKLLEEAGCKVTFSKCECKSIADENQEMGIKEILTVIATNGKKLYSALKLWLKPNRTKIKIHEKYGNIEKEYEIDTNNPDDVEKILNSIKNNI